MNEYSKSLKLVTTVIVIWASFNYMLAGSSFRSTLIDFKEITNTSMEIMSFSLMFRFLGCCIGSGLNYLMPEKANTTVIFSFIVISLGAFSIIIGQVTQLWSVMLLQFLIGMASGAIDVLNAAQIFELWKDEGGPYMQALSLAYNIAGICSPLLFEPFLSPTRGNELHELNWTHVKNESFTSFNEIFNTTFDVRKSVIEATSNESRIWIPLSITGIMLITSGLLVLLIPVYMYFKSKNMVKTKKSVINDALATNDSKKQTESDENKVKESNWKRFNFYILTLCSIVLCIYYAIHDTVMQFWLSFAVNCDLKLTKSQAAFMLSGMTTAYSVSGLIGIFVTTKVKPFKMLLILVIMIAVGNIIHFFFANTSLAMLWIGALIEYVGFGCFYATVFNYMQSKVGLTTRMCSVLVLWSYLASGVGYTSLIGYYVEAKPNILIYNNIGCSAIVALLMFAIYKLDTINKRKNEEHKIKLSSKETSVDLKAMVN